MFESETGRFALFTLFSVVDGVFSVVASGLGAQIKIGNGRVAGDLVTLHSAARRW